MGRLLAVEVQWAAPVHKYFLNEAQYARRARFDFSEDRETMRRCSQIVKAGTCRTPVLLMDRKQRRTSTYMQTYETNNLKPLEGIVW